MGVELNKDLLIRKYQQQLADAELRANVAETLAEQLQEQLDAAGPAPSPAATE